jgi:hypothetical protein
MKKIIIPIILAIALFGGKVRADEGMWLPLFIERLNYVDMQKEGLHLTAEEIWSVNHSSLKDAIIQFGGGCTGEIVSAEGLIFTNHHCGYGSIQNHSTVEHDYLTNGFWAMNKSEELTNPGLSARFLVRIEDVTGKVLGGVTKDMSEDARRSKLRENTSKIESEATSGTQYEARVSTFFNGNEFYLFVFETFRDVRLVGAPPSSIGKFGGDTDNWMWPRHTGDFSIFRVYTGPDGKPAAYSAQNVPLKPRHFLPVSIKGVQQGDFAMIMGYPGRTDRYATSYHLKKAVEVTNPATVKIRTKKLELMKQDMDASDDVRIKYSSKYAGIANYWKFYIGETRDLKRLKVIEKKQQEEADFTKWANSTPGRMNEYGGCLREIEAAYQVTTKYDIPLNYFREAIMGCELLNASSMILSGIAEELNKPAPDKAAIEKMKGNFTGRTEGFYKNYNAGTDKKILAAMSEMYYNDVPKDQQPAIMAEMFKKYKGNWNAFAEDVFSKSIAVDQQKLNAFLANPNKKAIDKDITLKLMKAFNDNNKPFSDATDEATGKMNHGKRLYMKGIMEMNPDKKFYPDANSTMRLTYGKIEDYFPADAVHYKYYTTLEGIMQKEDPTNDEFIVPQKLKDLYKARDYGRYGKDGQMYVGFLSNNDITGGNSGSPVMNANGELIGLAFDGNWEAMSGNYAFEAALQRTISVDVRYVLFIIDKYAGATNIIKELDIRN